MTAECATLRILRVEGACKPSGRMAYSDSDRASFEDLDGVAEGGSYLSIQDEDRDIQVGSLTFKPVADTIANQDYIFSFSVTNPTEAQNSPGIQVEGIGIPIAPTFFQKDTTTVLTSPCDAISLACRWTAGDAAPLKVFLSPLPSLSLTFSRSFDPLLSLFL